jgi:phosphoribosyl-ATP pyrophosphohydrolase
MNPFTLETLTAIIKARKSADAGASYTKSLLEKGAPRAAKKFGEEAVELVIAAIEGDKHPIVCESADVLYHLLVLLEASGVTLDEVLAELAQRTAQSGHQEKASRPAGPAVSGD